MPFCKRFSAAFCASLLSAGILAAQVPEAAEPAAEAPASLTLHVVASPRSGTPVAGLQQSDFTILDNKHPVPISSFRAVSGPEVPTSVIIVVDNVNTWFQVVSSERMQLDEFLQADGGHLKYPTSLGVLTDAGLNVQKGFTRDGKLLSSTLQNYKIGLRAINRSAGVYGANERIQISVGGLHQLAQIEASVPGRKMILWISPGWPILSGPEVELSHKQQEQLFNEIVALSNELRKADITLYSIDPQGTAESVERTSYFEEFRKGVSRPGNAQFGNLALQVLATQTGGRVLTGSNDVGAMLRKSLEDTQAFYQISFKPQHGEHPDEYHQIQVKLDKSGLGARTLEGYYAQP